MLENLENVFLSARLYGNGVEYIGQVVCFKQNVDNCTRYS